MTLPGRTRHGGRSTPTSTPQRCGGFPKVYVDLCFLVGRRRASIVRCKRTDTATDTRKDVRLRQRVPHVPTSMSLCVAVDTPHHWLRCDHEELVMSTDRQPTPSTIRTSVRGRHVSVKSSNSSGGNSSVCVEVLLDSCRLYSNFWRCCRADLKRQRFAVLLVCYEADAEEKCKIFASVTAFLREYLENNVQHHDDPIMCPQVMFVAMQRRSLSSTSSSSRTLVQSLAQCCNIPHVTIRCPVCFSPARHMITSHIAACAVTFYEMSRRRLKNNGSGQVLLPTAICPQKTQKCAVQ
eukprot:PhM_4_TR5952/c0_g1_i4/m.55175